MSDSQDHHTQAESYRAIATKAREKAESVDSEQMRETLLKWAVEYDRLAESFEQFPTLPKRRRLL